MSAYRILVTGSRHACGLDDAVTISTALREVEPLAEGRPIVVVHGRCKFGGADLMAARYAEQRGWSVEEHPADETPDGRILGPARNARMVATGPDVCVAFPDRRSRGTWDCVRKASDAGINVNVRPLGVPSR